MESLVAKRVSSGVVTNEDVSYVAPVVIGGKTWELIVDTGCKSMFFTTNMMLQFANLLSFKHLVRCSDIL